MTSLRTIWGLDLDKLNAIASGASTELLKAARPYFEMAASTKLIIL
jgi:oxygen-independent coproporphyrinogen-3 oxidase